MLSNRNLLFQGSIFKGICSFQGGYTSIFHTGGILRSRKPARCRLVVLGDAGSTFRQGSDRSMPGGLSADEATRATIAHPCASAVKIDGWRCVTKKQILQWGRPHEKLNFWSPKWFWPMFLWNFNMIASYFSGFFLYQHDEKKMLGWSGFWKAAWIIERAN